MTSSSFFNPCWMINNLWQFSIQLRMYQLIKQGVITKITIHLLQIYNQIQNKKSFQTKLLDFLPKDFKQFLVKYGLTSCEKKECNSLPIPRPERYLQEQYFCLICFKKMCAYRCGKPVKEKGNLTSHAFKKHKSQSIYLQIRSSKIIIMAASNFQFLDNTLYKNLISESPGSSYYENFKLNLKALDMIVDIILESKYLQTFKMTVNQQKDQSIYDDQILISLKIFNLLIQVSHLIPAFVSRFRNNSNLNFKDVVSYCNFNVD